MSDREELRDEARDERRRETRKPRKERAGPGWIVVDDEPVHQHDCEWTEDIDGAWDTSCGQKHEFTSGGPQENKHAYCPYCGRGIVAVMPVHDPDCACCINARHECNCGAE